MEKENFFAYSDDTIFHGIEGDSAGFTFGKFRDLKDDNEKIERLKKRLTSYYLDGLNELKNPFAMATLTTIGIEVLGQIMLGFDKKGETIDANTIKIYQKLDDKMGEILSSDFKSNYNRKRGSGTSGKDWTSGLTTYAHVVRKGYRNSFMHTYRSLGVFLDNDKPLIEVNEGEGCIFLNPRLFRHKFNEVCENCFKEALKEGADERKNAIEYVELLVEK